MKFNQFKYFYLMFFKNIKNYFRHIENLFSLNKLKNLRHVTFERTEEVPFKISEIASFIIIITTIISL